MALAFATIERPIVAQRLIRSVRRHFPGMPIYVADQSLEISAMASFYAAMDVTLLRMPYDAGVCASRNRLAAAIREEYFVLCDDDFVIGAITDFTDALGILQHHPEIGVVGGKLYDYDATLQEEHERHWELFLHLDPVNRTLTSVPISQYAPRAREIGAIRFYMCDAVMNFSVMRRAIFGGAVGWDDRFRSNGEHEDFFLNLKLNSPVRVAYLPTMIAYHHHPQAFSRYRRNLRDRLEGWRRFLAKWNIDQHLEIGLGVRTIDNLDACVAGSDAGLRFFANDDLSLRRLADDRETLQITQATRLSAIGVLDEKGEHKPALSDRATLLVRTGGGVRPGLDTDLPADLRKRLENHASETPRLRYGLGDPDGACSSRRRIPLVFRYNPVARPDADFILWCRATDGTAAEISVVLRWTADDGRILVWESRPSALDLTGEACWLPLLVELPLLPRDATFVRFDVLTEGPRGQHHVAVGFVFAADLSDRDPRVPGSPPAFDVLALSPWTYSDAEAAPWPATDLDRLRCPPADTAVAAIISPDVPGLLRLHLGDLPADQWVLLVGWPGMASALVHARRPGAGQISWPPQIAVPFLPPGLATPRLLGYRRGSGFSSMEIGGGSFGTCKSDRGLASPDRFENGIIEFPVNAHS